MDLKIKLKLPYVKYKNIILGFKSPTYINLEKSQALASIHVQIDPTKLPLLFIKTDLPNAMRCNFTSSGCTRHYFIVAKKTFAKSRKITNQKSRQKS